MTVESDFSSGRGFPATAEDHGFRFGHVGESRALRGQRESRRNAGRRPHPSTKNRRCLDSAGFVERELQLSTRDEAVTARCLVARAQVDRVIARLRGNPDAIERALAGNLGLDDVGGTAAEHAAVATLQVLIG